MNHCIQGGIGGGDGGECSEERRAAPAVAQGAPPAPHGDGIHGEAKTWLWWLQIRGYGESSTT